jgi:hypothetical protein
LVTAEPNDPDIASKQKFAAGVEGIHSIRVSWCDSVFAFMHYRGIVEQRYR